MSTRPQHFTADDLWDLSHRAGDQKRLELVRGEVREMPLSGGWHGEVAVEIGALVANHVKGHRLGRVTGAGTGYILSTDPDTVRAPDVGFVSRERAAERLTKGYIPFVPRSGCGGCLTGRYCR